MTSESKKPPTFLIGHQLELTMHVLDRIVPRQDRFPGAGELGVASYVDAAIGRSAHSRRLFSSGLRAIDLLAHRSTGAGFTELSDADKDDVLRQVELDEPDFFEELVRHTYTGYYIRPQVKELLGLEARPPQPDGYQLAPGDLSALDNVRKRGRIYREV